MKKFKYILFITLLFILTSCVSTSNTLRSITVIDLPEKVEIGKFNEAGIKLELKYLDGKFKLKELTEDMIPEKQRQYLYEEGTHNFNFLYLGEKVELTLTMYKIKYKIVFVNILDEIVKEMYYIPNEELTYPTDEEMHVEGYSFLGTYDQDLTNITKDLIVKGNYEKLHEHIYIEEVTKPTCTSYGYTVYKCSCGHVYEDTYIEPLGHDIITDESIKPTCTESGLTKGEHCSRCEYKVKQEVVPPTGHLYEKNICINCNLPLESYTEGLTYEFNETTKSYTVVGIGTANDTNIIIPSIYKDYPVTRIGDSAFDSCRSLESITIPESVTSIGDSAFYNCYYLSSINVSEKNQYYQSIDGNLYSKDGKTLIQYATFKQEKTFKIPNSVTSIGNSAFYLCRSLESITIPEGVTSIGDESFYECNNLTSITIPESVTNIGDFAFYHCKSFTNITIPEGVTSIGDSAFDSCKSLESIIIPESVISIGYRAFALCDSLISITIPEGATSIGDYALFYCSSLTSITIPESVTSIGDYAFYGCISLTSITIPKGVTSIDDSVFGHCISLTSITIPESVTSIGDDAFYNCTSLTNITIPEGVTSIGDSVFGCCTSLTSITIPEGVTSIGDSAFYVCTNLTNITIPEGVTSIGDHAFDYCTSLTSITIPESVTKIGNYAFSSCDSLTSINVSENNQYYKSIDGNLYTKDGKTLIQYATGKQEKTFKIPNSVTSIGNYAFYECDSLTSITIPEGVTSIGDHAFDYCTSLTSITIPASVTSIGYRAFSYCRSLTIYCKAISQPEGWDNEWNYSNRPVVWGA